MDDTIYIALGLALFLVAAAFVRACEALKE
jgi:hypothetical protein